MPDGRCINSAGERIFCQRLGLQKFTLKRVVVVKRAVEL
jgi:hypothetical protein